MSVARWCGVALGVVLGLGMAGAASGQSLQMSPATGGSDRPTASATPVAEGPTLDGDVVNDPIWAEAAPIGGFLQYQPFEGQPVSERTEVRMIFTRDTLYVGVVCYDSDPSGIIVADSRRDTSLNNTDSSQRIFDTSQDRQNGFVFGTNPAGIEYDGQVTNEGMGGGGLSMAQMSGSGGGFNLNWDGAWEVRAKISEIGWSAEFAIPFKTLRYPQGSDQTWGVNFQRNIRRKNEQAYWARIPRQFNIYRVSIAGSIAGIQPPVFRNFKVIPYVLGQVNKVGVRPVDSVGLGDMGADAKYNITPSLTLDATYNTDFAQVEVDDQQINLDRFTLFFPEKRPFFLENAGFFSVGNQGEVDLFFSRRIGLSNNGQAIPLYGGGRVSGKVGLWNVGLLNMQTQESEAFSTPSNNFGVVRLMRELPNRSAIGGLFVNRQGSGTGPRRRLQPDLLDRRQARRRPQPHGVGLSPGPRRPGVTADHAFNIRSRIPFPSDIDAGYQEVGEDFNPEVGFLTRAATASPTSG